MQTEGYLCGSKHAIEVDRYTENIGLFVRRKSIQRVWFDFINERSAMFSVQLFFYI